MVKRWVQRDVGLWNVSSVTVRVQKVQDRDRVYGPF